MAFFFFGTPACLVPMECSLLIIMLFENFSGGGAVDFLRGCTDLSERFLKEMLLSTLLLILFIILSSAGWRNIHGSPSSRRRNLLHCRPHDGSIWGRTLHTATSQANGDASIWDNAGRGKIWIWAGSREWIENAACHSTCQKDIAHWNFIDVLRSPRCSKVVRD